MVQYCRACPEIPGICCDAGVDSLSALIFLQGIFEGDKCIGVLILRLCRCAGSLESL